MDGDGVVSAAGTAADLTIKIFLTAGQIVRLL
jgi:hypothetical protein